MLPSLGWGVFWCFRARNRTGRPPAGGKKQSCGLFFSPREMDARVTKKLSLERGWAFSFVKNKYWNGGVWESKNPGPASASRGAKTALRAVFRVREIPRAVRQFAKRKHAVNRRRHIEQTGRGASGPRPYREKTESEQADLLAKQRKNGGQCGILEP